MLNQVEYLILYVAPATKWPAYSALFDASARSFRLLPGPDLSSVVLSNAEVGAGYKGSVIPGGDSFIGEATLDLCAGSYPEREPAHRAPAAQLRPRGEGGLGLERGRHLRPRRRAGGAARGAQASPAPAPASRWW